MVNKTSVIKIVALVILVLGAVIGGLTTRLWSGFFDPNAHAILYYNQGGRLTLYYGRGETYQAAMAAARVACQADTGRPGSRICDDMPIELKRTAGVMRGLVIKPAD